MKGINENELILYKAVTEYILSRLGKSLKKIDSFCIKAINEYAKLKKDFLNGKTYEEVESHSEDFDAAQKKMVHLLAFQDRICGIFKKNEQRLNLINADLQKQGIYNTAVDNKKLQEFILNNIKNINENNLNLNPALNKNIVKKSVNGKVLNFVDDKIDFRNADNQKQILTFSSDDIHNLIFDFPYVVSTMPDELFMSSNIKNNVLKAIIMFVAENLEKQSIVDSNRMLGSIIENSEKISSVAEYAGAVRNYFNVSVKQLVKKHTPDLADEIDDKLRCNEASEFLPSSKRIAVLANGIAGDAPKTEEEESEEIRKEQETEDELIEQLDNYLEQLLEEEEKENQENEKNQEIEEELEKNQEIESKEKTEKDELDELEEMLQSMLKKDGGAN